MCPTIKLSDELYSRLEKHAEGFDTPVQVITRILDSYDGVKYIPPQKTPQKDLTKYLFNGAILGKGKLVLAVVREYVRLHTGVTSGKLLTAFPKDLQVRGLGVFAQKEVAQEIYDRTGYKRYYINEDLIELKDCTIAVCSQWGKTNIGNFLAQAELLDFDISPV